MLEKEDFPDFDFITIPSIANTQTDMVSAILITANDLSNLPVDMEMDVDIRYKINIFYSFWFTPSWLITKSQC